VKKKHFIFIIQNNYNNRKHIKIKNKKDKSFKKKLKHEPNIVEITHLCIRHGVQTSKSKEGTRLRGSITGTKDQRQTLGSFCQLLADCLPFDICYFFAQNKLLLRLHMWHH
jgi:hypothetical protein